MKRLACLMCVLMILFAFAGSSFAAPVISPAPPAEPVKLIFIHHSTGGNWLADPNGDQPNGGLGRALMENNYYVSATNYGWGPEGIGDRTDIPNWPEWFLGPNRDTIMHAVYTENGQNVGDFGNWSRMGNDPGGENTIIIFKSCFPNSNLEGNPDDPPLDVYNDWEYSVANAKAVYLALLDYFRTRPDKLFVVITAPPLMESETTAAQALNAREFNYWLVHEWLQNYPDANVAVFDYFNVLTDPHNHHWWNGSEIERVQATDNNFAYYPSGDSHPSTEGHSKATAEFVPLLNVAYNRWQAGGPPVAPPVATEEPATEPTAPPETISPALGGEVERFEGEFVWFTDAGEHAVVDCQPAAGTSYDGSTALHLVYTIPAEEWGGCWRYYDEAQNWGASTGLTFQIRAAAPDTAFTLMVFSGDFDAPTPFEAGFTVGSEWIAISLRWDEIPRAGWADATGLQTLDPARITSLGFVPLPADGEVWLDDVMLFTGEALPVIMPAPEETATPESPAVTPAATEAATETPAKDGGLPCASAPLALALVGVSLGLGGRKRGLER